MNRLFNAALLLAALTTMLGASRFCISEDCEALKGASGFDAVSFLERGQVQTAECSKLAFQLIQHLPKDDAVPVLIKYLGYKRPQSDAERHGVSASGGFKEVLYPAVNALYAIGIPAEPALIEVVAQNDRKDSIERKNALYTLELIRHGDTVALLKSMHEHCLSLGDTPEGANLESAIQELKRRRCHDKLAQPCEDALKQ
jgi:hypothetical protein